MWNKNSWWWFSNLTGTNGPIWGGSKGDADVKNSVGGRVGWCERVVLKHIYYHM